MYCTEIYRATALSFALSILTGCAMTPAARPLLENGAASTGLSASADEETDLYRDAITALNNAKLEQAESEFQKIAKMRPEFAGPWVNLALIDIKKNDLAGAEKNLASARERNPKMPQIFNVLGFIEMSRGNINKAADDYRQAIALKENYAIAHYNYALLNDIYFQDIKVAAEHYRRYLALTDNQDKKTGEWVAELERRLAKGSQ